MPILNANVSILGSSSLVAGLTKNSTIRLFSIRRRRPNIIDIDTPFINGVDGYRLKWATNFDASFTTFLTAPNTGYLDSSINPRVIESQPVTGKVRIVFNPATFLISDTTPFWLRFCTVIGGAEDAIGAPTLVLTDNSHHGVGIVVISGTAPASFPLQLDLPGLMQDFRVINKSAANNLLISTETNGSAITLIPGVKLQRLNLVGTQGSLFVQGDGANVPFSATFTKAFPR